MAPNGKKPTTEVKEAAPEEAKVLPFRKPGTTAEAPEPTPAPEAEEFDWKAELAKLSPEERLKMLGQMYRETEIFLQMDEEERAAFLEKRKEKERQLKQEIELLSLSPEERKARAEDAKVEAEKIGAEMLKMTKEAAAHYLITVRAEVEKRRRAAESEELKELNTENSDELIDLFIAALKAKKTYRCAAIMRKLAADANENEIVNYFGYPSNIEGFHRFFAEVFIGRKLVKRPDGKFEFGEKIDRIKGIDIKPLYMEPQIALAIENDVSYIAEAKGHWGVARTICQKFGQFYQVSEEDQTIAAVSEMTKLNLQKIAREFNRLAMGGEIPAEAFNPEAGRDFQISRIGLALILNLSGAMENFMAKGEFNANAARNLWKIRETLAKAGVRPSFLNTLENYIKTIIKPDLMEGVRKAMDAPLPSLAKEA
jgi:hypothetical protein